jgi:aldehyde dehydrogenase (NAD+)
VWSEDVNLALDVARQVKAGVVWVNSTNLFDAASGFGGYRESGFGREGGREGLFEYVRTRFAPPAAAGTAAPAAPEPAVGATLPPIDRTPKLFIGGKQARPDSGYSRKVLDPRGHVVGEVGEGNRKDLRNAVEAARAASGWGSQTAHNRAQVLYYVAENLSVRAEELVARVGRMTGDPAGARAEVESSVERLFACAAWADKWDGAVHHTPLRNVTLAMNEAVGTVGVLCPDEAPLLAFVTLVGGAIAMGNTVVVVPSERHPLAATDFYQVLETSDVPAGVVNIVTGVRDELAKVLAEHADVDAAWYFGGPEGAALVERASVGNLKQTWTASAPLDWTNADLRELLRHATQVKNIWVPYGA